MKEIWFIRHGESVANAGGRSPDVKFIPLTDIGHEQAAGLIEKFDKAPDLIVASPYIRTQQTSEPVRKIFPQTSYEIWDVQEFTCLDTKLCANSTKEERTPISRAYWATHDPNFVHGYGAESFSQMLGRVRAMIDSLIKRDEQFIAVFTHGFFLKAFKSLLQNPELDDKRLMLMMQPNNNPVDVEKEIDNCQIIKAVIENDQIRLA